MNNERYNNLPQRLRAKEISKLFGIGLSTVWLLSNQKKLTSIKVSSRVTVFDTQEVLELFSNKEV